MIKFNRKTKRTILIGAITFSLMPLTAFAAAPLSTAKTSTKPPCRVDMPLAHPSTKLAEQFKVHAVKVNVKINCDKLITHLTLHVDLFKKAFPFPVLLDSFYYDKNITILPHHEEVIPGPVFVCENWKATAFFSEVSSTAVINGEKLSAPKRRSFSKIVACGN